MRRIPLSKGATSANATDISINGIDSSFNKEHHADMTQARQQKPHHVDMVRQLVPDQDCEFWHEDKQSWLQATVQRVEFHPTRGQLLSCSTNADSHIITKKMSVNSPNIRTMEEAGATSLEK